MSELAIIKWLDMDSADADGYFFVCLCGYESKRFALMYQSEEAFQEHVRAAHGDCSRIPGAKKVRD